MTIEGNVRQGPVVAFGELLWDVLPSGKVLGGAPANFAYRLNSFGRRIHLISRLGEDELGREARTRLGALGVPLADVQTDPVHPTGSVPVTLTAGGSPSFTILPDVAYDYIEWTEELEQAADSAALICFGTLIQRSPVSRTTLYRLLERATGAVKLLDINLRPHCYSPETVRASLERADILKLNDAEVGPVAAMTALPSGDFDAFAKALFVNFGITYCLITLGADGVVGYSRSGERVQVPGKRVSVVDTIGAGDAFTAGFVHEYLNGAALERCCIFGNEVGAAVATVEGGMSPITLP